MKTNLNRIIALLGAAFVMNVASATDHPHIKPLQVAADINSVDLLSGKFYPNLPTLSIPAAPRLTLETMQQFDSKITGILYAAVDAQGNSTGDRRETYSLTFGGKTSESFTCISYECKAADGTGSRLLGNMNANFRQFTYTQGSSGIKVRYTQLSSFFDNTGHAYNAKSYEGTWYTSQIIYPDGEKIDIAYTTAVSGFITHHRPLTVTSNTGYQLELTYQSADINNAGWGKPASAKLVKSTAPAVVLAQHTYSGNTITDLLGRSYTIAGFGSALGGNDYANTYSQTLPGDSSASLSVSAASYNYGGTTHNNYVTGVVRDGLSYTYTYTASTGSGYDSQKQFSKVVINGPDGYSRTVDLQVFPAPEQRQLIKSDTDSAGRTTQYTYSDIKQLESVTYPEGNKEIYTYDSMGNITHKRLVAKVGSGQSDIVTQANYTITTCTDTGVPVNLLCFRPEYTIDGKGNRTDYTFDATHGNLLTKLEPADANGIRRLTTNTWQQVNSIWRLTETSVCGQGSCSGKNKQVTKYSYWNYTALPATVTKTNAEELVKEITTYDYDEAGRLLSEDGPLAGNADASYSRYDSVGRKTWSIGPVNQNGKRLATKTVYRSRDDQVGTVYQGYVNSETDTSLASTLLTTTNSYNSTGLLVKTEVVSDQNEKLTNISYDGRNRQSCVAIRMNPAQFASAPADACVKGTKGDFGDDRITQHSYDVNSRLIKTISGLGTTAEGIDIEMTYTANGQVETRKDGNGNTTSYSYDGFDRLKRTSYPDGTYEENGYDANSNVTTLRKRDGTTLTHSFDNVNRLSQTTVPSEDSIVFGYDSLGRETSVTRGSQTVTSTYEDLGRLQTSSTNGKTLTYGYDGAGRRNKLTYPDNFNLTYSYQSDNSLSAIYVNNAVLPLVSYSYNNMSRLTAISRGNNVISELGHTPLNQLQNFDHRNINKASFQYSPAGQLTSRVTTSADYQIQIPQPGRQDYLPNNLNQYTSYGGQSFSYDNNGNLTNFDGWTYNYNKHNRLISASTSGQSLTLGYDAIGRLNSSTLNGTQTTFLYDGNELIAEYNAAGTLLKRYVHGIGSDDPLVSYDGAGTTSPTYLLADERGSIMAETNSAGTVTTKHQYGPYGEPINQSASRFRYTGQILLPGTALYHYKARVYHPKLGRFLQTDPIGYKDGMNWYAYVGNDPMNFSDSSGKARHKGDKSGIAAANLIARAIVASTEKGSDLNTAAQKVVDLTQKMLMSGVKVKGGVSPSAGSASNDKADTTIPYKRPSGATTPAQRASVQDKPCVDCGAVTPKQVADHKTPLVVEYYETGTIDTTRMRSIEAVQPQCPTCSAKQGAEMSRYSQQMKKELGLD